MSGLIVRTCAKVNLCLRVLGRRDDGFHEVETVLHTVSLWDRVRLSPLPKDGEVSIGVTGGDVPADESNLCWQAARVLAERVHPSGGVAIDLEKSIPVGAGLGGGSSDAAATLAGLARLWEADLRPEEMEGIAANLGADVPFFLRGGCCLARGRGEKLDALPSVPLWMVVVVPERRVPTAQAYAALGRGTTSGRRRGVTRAVQHSMEALKLGEATAVAASLHNDFESLEMAGIAEARDVGPALKAAGCLGASLTGTGSAVFGLARDRVTATRAAAQMRTRWDWVEVVQTVAAGEGLVISSDEEGEPS